MTFIFCFFFSVKKNEAGIGLGLGLPRLDEEDEYESSKTTPEDENKYENNGRERISSYSSVTSSSSKDAKNNVKIRQIQTIFNPNTLVARTTTTGSSSQNHPSSSSSSSSQQPSSSSSSSRSKSPTVKINRLLKRAGLRGIPISSRNKAAVAEKAAQQVPLITKASASDEASCAASHQQEPTPILSTSSSSCNTTSADAISPSKMQAEQGSIGDLHKYQSRYLKNRRHTLANVR